MSTLSNQEVVHEGWLIKSPPSKRILRARWRRRWFALRQSGELPGQYVLQYYTDRNCRKLKGTIDLDQCEQVDAGLRYEQRKLKYQFMFDIKTPSRTYYLAAETEQDMNSWVEYICQVCSLKVYNNEYLDQTTLPELSAIASSTATTNPPELVERPDVEAVEIEESDNTDNTSYLGFNGPYIPISQCITGKPLTSPTGCSGPVLMDDMYDFPRTHHTNEPVQNARVSTKHFYNNAAPVFVGNSSEGHVFRYDISPTERGGSQVFHYDFAANATSPTTTATTADETTDEPASPCSQSSRSTTAMYSNVPSPLLAPNQNTLTPPAVNRELKPGRNLSDSTSIHSLDTAPSVNRKLKPTNLLLKNSSVDNAQDNGEYGNIRKNSRTNISHNDLSENFSLLQILPYNALDSPTQFDILQYLDLDLDVDNNTTCTGSLSNLQANSNMHPPRPNSRVTVYKTVDFVKTDAFNRIKKTCEAERNKLPPSDP